MSNIYSKSPFAMEPLEDRIDILFKELELAIKWQRPSILLAIYSSEYVHTDAATALENQLIDNGLKVVRISIKESDSLDVAALIAAVDNAEKAVFFVDGLRWAVQKDGTNIYRVLNTSRENFINRHIRVVFWLTENEAIDLARYAPDYWAYRHRVVEFIESPEPEQILLRSLNSAWQVFGEDTDTIENTDEKIALRRGMLAELPDRSEAMAIRSNLLLSLGILYWRKGAMDTAMEHLNEALEIATNISDPRLQAACFNAIAIVQTDLGQVDDAITSYRKTIALAPNQTFTWNNLGNLYEKLDRCEEAIDAFMMAIKHAPTDALAWNGLGNVYLKLHQNADAIAAYKKSIEFAADLAYPWNGLGNAYASQGEFDAAIPAYQKSVALNKDFSIPWVNLGDIYQELGNNQDALKAYWNAVRIDSKNAQIWNSLGTAYMSSGLCEEAIKSYNKAIKLNRSYETAYTNLAAAYSLVGNYEESIAYYQKSVELLSGQKLPAARNQIEQTYRQFVLADLDELEIDEVDEEAEVIEDPVDLQIKAMLQEIDPNYETELEEELEEAAETDDDEALGELTDGDGVEDEEADQLEQPVVDLPDFLTRELSCAAQFETPAAGEELSVPDAPTKALRVEGDAGVNESGLGSVVPEAAFEEKINLLLTETAETATDESVASFGAETTAQPDVFAVPEMEAVSSETDSDSHESPTIEIVFQDIEQLIEIEVHGSEADQFEQENDLLNPATGLPMGSESLSDVPARMDAGPVPSAQATGDERAVAAQQPRFERMPKDAFVWNELGNIYFNISEYEDAVAAYKQAISLDSSLGWGYSNLALTYSLQGRYDEAIQVYGKIIYLLTTPDEKISWRGPGNLHVIYNWMGSLRQVADSWADQAESKDIDAREISVEDIYTNPERPLPGVDVDDLVNSVREQGVLRPLIVTPNGKPGKFMLVSGLRRLAAARRVGLQTVPVIVREENSHEKIQLALFENARRYDLSPLELAEAYFRLTEEFHFSLDELAARLGKSRTDIANTLSLLKLSEKVKQALSDQAITEGHASALLALSTPLAQNILLKNILDKKLSVQQTEELVRNSVGRKPSFLFADREYEEPGLPEYEEAASPASILRRKSNKPNDFSLISRARSVLRSNYQPAISTDGLSPLYLAQEGEVHE